MSITNIYKCVVFIALICLSSAKDIDFAILPVHPQSESILSNNSLIPDGFMIKNSRFSNQPIERYVILKPEELGDSLIGLEHVATASISNSSEKSKIMLNMELNKEGLKRLSDLTELTQNMFSPYSRLAIIVNNSIVSMPYLSPALTKIGGITVEIDAKEISYILNKIEKMESESK